MHYHTVLLECNGTTESNTTGVLIYTEYNVELPSTCTMCYWQVIGTLASYFCFVPLLRTSADNRGLFGGHTCRAARGALLLLPVLLMTWINLKSISLQALASCRSPRRYQQYLLILEADTTVDYIKTLNNCIHPRSTTGRGLRRLEVKQKAATSLPCSPSSHQVASHLSARQYPLLANKADTTVHA